MVEKRIDCAHQSDEELKRAKELAQLVFRLNHTMPMTEEYEQLVHEVFPNQGKNNRIQTPVTVVRAHEVRIGNGVIIMPGCLMMAAGGITIDDDCRLRQMYS